MLTVRSPPVGDRNNAGGSNQPVKDVKGACFLMEARCGGAASPAAVTLSAPQTLTGNGLTPVIELDHEHQLEESASRLL